jgi:hypothetical protein
MSKSDRTTGAWARREFLRAAAGASLGVTGALASGCGGDALPTLETTTGPTRSIVADLDPNGIFVPKINDGMTVHLLRRLDSDPNEDKQHPVIIPELIALQLRFLYENGFDGMRLGVSIVDRPALIAAVLYVRAARALGIDALVLLTDDSGVAMANALWSDHRRAEVLRALNTLYAVPPAPAAPRAGGLGPNGVGRIAFEILNEPAVSVGLPPDVYVQEILVPTFVDFKALNPQVLVVSAAEVGTPAGPPRVRAMLEAGLEGACDRIAYHIYDRSVVYQLPPHVRATVWITETAAGNRGDHLVWMRDVYSEIRGRLTDVTRLFWYDLFDGDVDRFRLIDIAPAGGSYRAIVESTEVVQYLTERTRVAAAGRPLHTFDALIPDIRAYSATAADIAIIDRLFEA